MTSHEHAEGGPGTPAARVLGPTVDDQTRCVHYAGPLDIVAIPFRGCGEFYPCFPCHAETVAHPVSAWPAARFDERAILCGVCRTTLTISDYLESVACPSCAAQFNPGCSLHHSIYFE